MKNVSKSKWK